MMKALKIQGSTTEKKFEHLETILERLSRKLNKTVVAVMPLVPFMGYVERADPRGVVVSGLVPGECRIVRLCLAVETYADADTPVEFKFEIGHGDNIGVKVFSSNAPLIIEEVGFEVPRGTLMTLRVDDPSLIVGIRYGILFDMGSKLQTSQEFIIDELLRLTED
jgi:hypothetical protein